MRERDRSGDALSEGAFRRAGRDTLDRVESVRGVALEVGASAACSAVVGVWLADWDGSPWVAAAMTFGAGVAGLVLVLIVFGAVSVALAPVRQRNEARGMLAEREAWDASFPELVLALIREGRRLKDRIIGAPLMKETSPGNYGGPFATDPDAMREVDAFNVRARDLLAEHDDSLLPVYAAAARAAQAEDARSSDQDGSGLAPVLTPELLAEKQKAKPLADLDAYLSGLAAVRHKLLDWGAQRPSRSRAS